jgi:hypothetical protein
MHSLLFAASTLLAAPPFAASGSPAINLARAFGGLVGIVLFIWLLWTSHVLRVVVWALAVLGAASRLLLVVADPRFSAREDMTLVAAGVLSLVFLLFLGWLGRTSERSRIVLLGVVGLQLVMVFVIAGYMVLNPSAMPSTR